MLNNKILRKVLAVSLASVMLCGTGFTTVGQFVGTGGITVNAVTTYSYGNFKYVVDIDGITIKEYTANGGNVTIPTTINGKTVTAIGSQAFYGRTGLTGVIIPASVKTVGSNAFSGCDNVAVYGIKDSYAQTYANNNNIPFAECYQCGDNAYCVLDSNDVLNVYGMGDMYDYYWDDDSGSESPIYSNGLSERVKEIIIEDGITSLGDSIFFGCSELTNVTIPDSVTKIGGGVFENSYRLKSIEIPDSVTEIGNDAFKYSALQSIIIPDSVTEIDEGVFYSCICLESVEIPESVTEIGRDAFFNCDSLTSIDIPDSVTSIGYGAFEGCTGLTSITIPDSVTEIGGWAFYGCTGLTSIDIPDSVTSIGNSAFYGCTGLTSIIIPDSVTSIGEYAFLDCVGLTSVVIPNSNTKIDYGSFAGCDNLTIYGRKGSSAETVANSQNIPFVELADYIEGFTQTCTEDGKKSYYHNNFDGKDYEDYDCKKVITNPESWIVIPATGHNYKDKVVAPTCTQKGYTLHTCENCGDKYKDTYIKATGHSYEEKVTAPTCTEQGYTVHTCSACGDSYTDNYTKPTGHSYKDKVVAPTCTQKGYTLHTCENCGDSYKDTYTDATGHSYELISEKASTCTEHGEKIYKCSVCGDTKKETLELAKHHYTAEVIAPTCTKKGYTLHTCSECGHNYKDTYTEPTGHSYELTDENAPTCTENGKKVYQCSVCGNTKTEVVNATGHNYTATVIAPTCTEQGYTLHTCENCGDSYKDTYTNATGHKFELTEETAPTCTEEGEKIYECTECGYTRANVIAATGHHYKKEVIAPTTEEEGYTLHTCKDCGNSYKDSYKAKLLANRATLSAETIVIGRQITVTAHATGGTGEYQYQILYKQKSQTKWTTAQAFSENAEVTFKPAKAVDYDVCVKVKDSNGTVVKKFFDVKVNAKLANTSALSAENIVIGQKVTVNCLATGGMGGYQYQVLYKQTSQNKWTTAQAFAENTAVTFKPSKATTYDVCIKVKDSEGTVIKKFFTVQVNAKLANTSDISSTEIKKGSTVTVSGSATGGMGDYQYQVLYKQTSQTKWTVKQDFDANSIVSVKPAKTAEYDICVKVQDKTGTIAKKYFTVNVTA